MIKKEFSHLISTKKVDNYINAQFKKENKQSIFNEEESIFEKHDQILAKELGDLLFKHYPKYMWLVNVSSHQGVVQIMLGNVMGKYGFTIKIQNVIEDPSRKRVILAGGEVLERYNLRRGKASEGELESLETIGFTTMFDGTNMTSGSGNLEQLKAVQNVKRQIEEQVKKLKG